MRQLAFKTLRACALPILGLITAVSAHPAAAYAASAVLHMVVLGSLAYWLPGDSDPTFWMGSGNGGIGDQASPVGSAGGAPLTTVFHFELPASPPLAGAPPPAESELLAEPLFVASGPPDHTQFAPMAIETVVQRNRSGPAV